jgi:hypothetical protein
LAADSHTFPLAFATFGKDIHDDVQKYFWAAPGFQAQKRRFSPHNIVYSRVCFASCSGFHRMPDDGARSSPEIAGELIAATRADGASFVQFTKTPFPFAVAQTSPTGWQIEFPPENRRYAGPGTPPSRIGWFQLSRALAGSPLALPWSWQSSQSGWRLENSSTGESLEGYFTQ